MTEDADIVVAGAGHNSLLTACYLAKAGYRCLVLDARDIPGGGAATEELLLPGFGIDTCATGHTMIRVNPVLSRDELGLVADYGLRYAEPDPVEHVAFPDGGSSPCGWTAERTAEEVARFSAADAAAYRRLLADYDEVKHIFTEAQFTPVGSGPSLDQRLAEHPRGRIWARRRQLSAGPGRPARVHQPAHPGLPAVDGLPGVPAGGRAGFRGAPLRPDVRPPAAQLVHPGRRLRALTAALTGYLADHGGEIRCGQAVTRLLLEDGRCAGVQTQDGTAVPGAPRGGLHHPRQAPARHGAGRGLARGVPLRGGHLRRGRARLRHLLLHHRAAGVRRRGRAAHARCRPAWRAGRRT